jgi:prepilin peptidase CpaA
VPDLVPAVLLSIWALAIAAYDAWRLRVPNLFLAVIAAPALVAEAAYGKGLLGVAPIDAGLGILLGLVIPLSGYVFRVLGAGDVKYGAVIGLLCGVAATGRILLVTGLVLGVMSLLALVESRWRHRPPRRLPAAAALSTGFVVQLASEFGHGIF